MIPYLEIHSLDAGPFSFSVWGLTAAVGILVGCYFGLREAQRQGMNKVVIINLMSTFVLSGLIGARLFYFFYDPEQFFMDPVSILYFWEGGAAFSGGLIGGLLGGFLYVRWYALPFFRVADIMLTYVPLAHAIGRIGCYLTGMHIGKLTTMPWGVMVEGELRHHVAVYEFFGLLIIFGLMLTLRKYKSFDGFLVAWYLILYSTLRFALDFFRDIYHDPTYWGLTPAQFVMIGVFVLGSIIMAHGILRTKKSA